MSYLALGSVCLYSGPICAGDAWKGGGCSTKGISPGYTAKAKSGKTSGDRGFVKHAFDPKPVFVPKTRLRLPISFPFLQSTLKHRARKQEALGYGFGEGPPF